MKRQISMQALGLALILVLALPSFIHAKQRSTPLNLMVVTKNGGHLHGRLVRVRGTRLDLISFEGTMQEIDFGEISTIRISKPRQASAIPLLAGGGVGLVMALRDIIARLSVGQILSDYTVNTWISTGIGITGITGLILSFINRDQTFRLEKESPGQRRWLLERLQSFTFEQEEEAASGKTDGIIPSPKANPGRFRVSIDAGYTFPQEKYGFFSAMKSTRSESPRLDVQWFDPSWEVDPEFYMKNIHLEYSILPQFSLGVRYSNLKKGSQYTFIEEFDAEGEWLQHPLYRNRLGLFHEGNAFFLTASYNAASFFSRFSPPLRVGVGLGMANISARYETYYEANNWEGMAAGTTDSATLKKWAPAVSLFASYQFHIFKNLSLGVQAEYKYIPVSMDETSLGCRYGGTSGEPVRIETIHIPAHSLVFGGFSYGLMMQIHF